MRKDITNLQSSFVAISGDNGYELNARFWQADDAKALLVLVHGVVSHSEWMNAIAAPLAQQGISSLAIDRRGAGLNTQARGDAPSADALLKDLHAGMQWATEQSLPIHLCGFCWGSNYVVNYLTDYNANIASMLFIAPSLFPAAWIVEQPFEVGESSEATQNPIMPIDQFTDGPMFESYIKPDPHRLRKVSTRMNSCMQSFSRGIWMKFLRLRHPCFMLLGEKDSVVDNTATLQVFDRLPVSIKKCLVLNACHGIQFDMPDAAANSIAHWIQTEHLAQADTHTVIQTAPTNTPTSQRDQ